MTRRIFRAFQLLAILVTGWSLISSQPRPAFAQTAPFYQGKTIRIIVGFTAGGLYDQYARILARHMPKDFAVSATINVQNMGGAGSLTTTNYVYSVAEPDGLTLGIKATNVRGYPGGVEIDLAIEKGEIHCRGTGITTHYAREPYFTWHKTGFDRHIVQTGTKKDPRLPDAPILNELMDKKKTPPLGRNVARLMLLSATLGRPMITTPGTPPDRVKILREAYLKALKEPEVIAEAKKSRMDLETLGGEEIESEMREVMNQPREVIERVKKLSE